MATDNSNPFNTRARTQTQTQTQVSQESLLYLKQVYLLLASSLMVAVAAGYVGMRLPFAYEHPIILIFMELGALFLAFKMRNAATLFLFTGLSGLSLGPLIAMYISAGMSDVVGQAIFMTGSVFIGLSLYALTTRRDLSMMGGILFAGLIVVVVGSIINLFLQTTALSFALSAIGAVVFSGFIVFETQQLKAAPWATAPSVAALSMYLSVINLFLSLLRILGILSEEE